MDQMNKIVRYGIACAVAMAVYVAQHRLGMSNAAFFLTLFVLEESPALGRLFWLVLCTPVLLV